MRNIKSSIESLKNGRIFESKGVIGNCYYHLLFKDVKKPLIITFSNAGEITKLHQLNDCDYRPWGFSFVESLGLNVLSFSALESENWYLDEDLQRFILNLNDSLRLFPARYGYGGSMGGFGVSVYSKILLLNSLLLINPISSLSSDLAPFETRFEYGRNLDWNCKYNDGANITCPGYIVYDPLFDLDSKHAKRYKNLVKLKLSGVGHGMPMHLNKIGVLGKLFKSFIEGDVNKEFFFHAFRARKSYDGYYNWMLSNENIHLTEKRKFIIEKYFLEFKLRNLKSQKTVTGVDINTIRDCALALENVDLSLALELMKLALRLRPEGKLIREKYIAYSNEI